MNGSRGRLRRVFGALLWVSAVGFGAAGCSDVRPAPDDEGGGVLESPTHESDTLRESEERQEGRGGGIQ
jgi:hypothetical protein